MSNTYTEAADAIKRAAKQYEVFVKAAEVLDRAGSFEQAAKEAEKAAAKAHADMIQAQAKLVEAEDAVAEAEGRAKLLVADAEVEAAEIISEAKFNAEVETNNGKAAGQAAAGQIVEQAKRELDRLTVAIKAQSGELERLRADSDKLTAECRDLLATRVNLEKAIDSLKSKFI